MYNNNKIIRRYSESFKLKLLSELSNGNYTKSKLAKIYGINPSTINEWIKKYDRKDLMNARVVMKLENLFIILIETVNITVINIREFYLKKSIKISMTEDNHCYENAVAERVNGILKDEFFLDSTFFSTKIAQNAVKNAIKLYNNERLHVSLGYKTPNSVHKKII